MSSPLDRIEREAQLHLADDPTDELAADILALVNVAKAAEHILAHGKLGKQSERRLREALAALNKDQS